MRLADWREGWRTDAIPHRFDGELLDRADFLVVRTPSNPTYYWGNCLVLDRLPGDDELGYDGRLAATCGLMRDRPEAGVDGRFQRVVTPSAFRRRGLARAMVHGVARHALEQWCCRAVYMAADPDDVAVGLYRSLGFSHLSTGIGLQRNAPADRAAPRSKGAA